VYVASSILHKKPPLQLAAEHDVRLMKKFFVRRIFEKFNLKFLDISIINFVFLNCMQSGPTQSFKFVSS